MPARPFTATCCASPPTSKAWRWPWAHGQGVESHVSLWVNTSAVNGMLRALRTYLAENPATKIDLEEALSDAVVRAVSTTGAADLGIFFNNIPAAGLEATVRRRRHGCC